MINIMIEDESMGYEDMKNLLVLCLAIPAAISFVYEVWIKK
ncbi:hypothetical protein ChMG5_orf002 [Klebsiella phage ChM-G5]|nr:hypothetical protein ChMG5_orf002 [Klebsiella phage ChM-G5]